MCGSCGFFCIVLNLVDNREWVGWVGLLPTLIGKPVDELENLAEFYFNLQFDFLHYEFENLLLPCL